LHGKDLKITSAKLTKHDKKGEQEITIDRLNLQKSFDEIRLHSKSMIYPGQYVISLEFSGRITRGMTGIYPCFFDHKGKEHSLLMTQFESHHAREAFPCIDEPEAKAAFDLTLITEPGVVVLGNTPVAHSETRNSKLETRFETTPKMSSYLLAFVAGELQSKSTKTNRGVEVNVWATVAQPSDSLDFPLEIAKKSIEYFEEYFGVSYPLPKADHVACPDFSAGAMENWGLITYRERVMLAYPGETGQSMLEQIAFVIAHETSHQWFGNLVTMRWWDDLWLNESFANLMEYQAVDAMYPQWRVWDSFVAQEGLSALRRDATPGVQAVKTTVNHPDEINTLFDPSIVYAKGGRLLYMLKNFVGDETFRQGLSEYFKKHAYGNTTGTDLWAALSKASGKDIRAFMTPWLEQSGFPVVSVTQDGSHLVLVQAHFQDDPKKADPKRHWPVPLFVQEPEDAPEILEKSEQAFSLKNEAYIGVNSDARGHYIVHYTEAAHRAELAEFVAAGKPSNAERLMLLNDASMLARAGYQPYADVLKLLAAYQDEASEPVWDMISLIIGETRRFIDLDESLEDKIKQLIRKLIIKQYERLGWEEKPDEPSSDQKLRATIIGLGSYAD
ncbi:MAG TPA: M1 family metallopeptidase, partial [Candidatus Saccharimonadaceae bacterium]|nr:M1 family metallopeptidase [Candidatus Saccharimonadaceae bacterium]